MTLVDTSRQEESNLEACHKPKIPVLPVSIRP